MRIYKIREAFLWTDATEIEIKANGLHYLEMSNAFGVQCENLDNQKEIQKKCKQVADLIREIDELNKL